MVSIGSTILFKIIYFENNIIKFYEVILGIT